MADILSVDPQVRHAGLRWAGLRWPALACAGLQRGGMVEERAGARAPARSGWGIAGVPSLLSADGARCGRPLLQTRLAPRSSVLGWSAEVGGAGPPACTLATGCASRSRPRARQAPCRSLSRCWAVTPALWSWRRPATRARRAPPSPPCSRRSSPTSRRWACCLLLAIWGGRCCPAPGTGRFGPVSAMPACLLKPGPSSTVCLPPWTPPPPPLPPA